jgi:hypothetical protein
MPGIARLLVSGDSTSPEVRAICYKPLMNATARALCSFVTDLYLLLIYPVTLTRLTANWHLLHTVT